MIGAIVLIVAAALGAILLMPRKAYGSASKPVPAGRPAGYESIDEVVAENASRYGVEAALIKAVIRTESNFNPNAENPSDPSYGLMQITPGLAEDYGVVKDHHNPTEAELASMKTISVNVRIGTWFLSRLLKKYPFDTAVQMYNVGESGYNNEGHRAAGYLAKVKGYYNEYLAV